MDKPAPTRRAKEPPGWRAQLLFSTTSQKPPPKHTAKDSTGAPPRRLRQLPSLRKEGLEKKEAARCCLRSRLGATNSARFSCFRILAYFLWRSLRIAASCAARDASSASTVA